MAEAGSDTNDPNVISSGEECSLEYPSEATEGSTSPSSPRQFPKSPVQVEKGELTPELSPQSAALSEGNTRAKDIIPQSPVAEVLASDSNSIQSSSPPAHDDQYTDNGKLLPLNTTSIIPLHTTNSLAI